jgi:protein-tyrosine phosphatase
VSGLVSAVAVEGDGEGCLLVSWVADRPIDVDVAVGPTPEAVDHTHARRVPAAEQRVRLEGLGPGRHYVSVAPAGEGGAVVAAERLVPLEGAVNFRDLGGYPTRDGGHTRWGRVFRSAGLHRLTLADRVQLERLGLRVVYDLRRDDERERDPNAVGDDLRAVPVPLMSGKGDMTNPDGVAFLLDVYREMIAGAAPLLASVLTGLTEPDGVPAVFHCAAGKDRTGITAAMLLSVLGVGDEHILDDYALTERYSDGTHPAVVERMLADGFHPDALVGLASSPRHLMGTIIEEVRAAHGSAEAYLVAQGGLDPEVPAELRRLLVQR